MWPVQAFLYNIIMQCFSKPDTRMKYILQYILNTEKLYLFFYYHCSFLDFSSAPNGKWNKWLSTVVLSLVLSVYPCIATHIAKQGLLELVQILIFVRDGSLHTCQCIYSCKSNFQLSFFMLTSSRIYGGGTTFLLSPLRL